MPQREALRELRRGQIVAAARRLVGDDGLDALTFGALEKRLAFTRGVITYHFKDKKDIEHAVLASAVAEINSATRARLTGADRTADRVRTVIEAYVRGFLGHVEATRVLVSFWGRIGSDKRARKANADLYRSYRRGAVHLLAEGLAAGEVDPAGTVNLEAMGAVLVGVVLGIAMQGFFDDDAIDVEAVIAEAVAMALARLRV